MQKMTSRFKKRFTASLALVGLLFNISPALAFDPNYIISDSDMTDRYSMDFNQIYNFLARGALATYRTTDVDGQTRYAAEIIWRIAQNNGINPKVILVLLQKEQSLIEDDSPTQDQLDWATGYAVCDDCSKSDPTLNRWRGFTKQVNAATLQFIEGYMADIAATGVTAGKYGPNKAITIDGTTVIPKNAATAALYAYTPHLHGNENFAALWQQWFGRDYPSGTLVQVQGEPDVWLIKGGYRQHITSMSALQSRYNPDLIVPISGSALTAYPQGADISFPNYSLLQDEQGTVYLLVDDTLRPIDSHDTFAAIGFSDDEIVAVKNTDISQYAKGSTITKATSNPQGKVFRLSTNGVLFYVHDGVRQIVLDQSIIRARFPGITPTSVQPAEIEQYQEGPALLLPDGVLVKSAESATVYVISEGLKRPIPSESVFTSYGYNWKNIITVPATALNMHHDGDPLQAAIDDSVQTARKE
jgi:hypothetical protein